MSVKKFCLFLVLMGCTSPQQQVNNQINVNVSGVSSQAPVASTPNIDSNSAVSSPPTPASTPIPPGDPPLHPPTGLTVSDVTNTSAVLNWNAVKGASTYKIYRDGSLYEEVNETTLNVTGLAPNTQYEFTVEAANTHGVTSKSDPAFVQTKS